MVISTAEWIFVGINLRLLSILKRWESCLTKKKDYMPPENATKAGWRHLLFLSEERIGRTVVFISKSRK
jgi:hypothetical protein